MKHGKFCWPWQRPKVPIRDSFDPSTPVLELGGDHILLGQCFGGIASTGEIGAGKTSGPGDYLARGLLSAGCGFVVLCAKDNEALRWQALCESVGRGSDYRRVYPGGPLKCDFLKYEMSQPGASVESSCQMLDKLIEVLSRQSGKGGDEAFWLGASQRLMRAAMNLAFLVEGSVSIDRMYRVLLTAPSTPKMLQSDEWRTKYLCGQLIEKAAGMSLPGGLGRDLQLAIGLIEEQSGWGEKTRGIVMTMVQNTLSKFLGGDVYDLCSSGEVTISPDDARAGKIICIDVPVLKFNEIGIAVALVWKQITQRAILRSMQDRPTVLWCDEAQFFTLPDTDVKFATVSREYRGIDVMLFQNLEVIIDALGGDQKAEKQAYSLLANHTLKFACANSSTYTNEYYEKLFGGSWQHILSGSIDPDRVDLFDDALGTGKPPPGFSFSTQYHPDMRANEMSKLCKGGPANDLIVECYVYMGGRTWGTGKTWKKVAFRQQG